MNHQSNLKTVCRLCIQNITKNKLRSYSVTNVWIQEFITCHFEESPNFSTENDTVFPKQICHGCYYIMYNFKVAEEKHKKSQAKKSRDRRTEFVYSGTTVNIPSEENFHHSNDCKVCGDNEEIEEQVEQPHVQASPGTYKRKEEVSPSLTPRSKRLDMLMISS